MLLKTMASFFKIGWISFGGGTAVTPVVEDEIVERNHYITRELFAEHTVLSNITPGALPVKLGALAGYEMSGIAGMLAASVTVALPGVITTIFFLAMLSSLGKGAVHQIELASVGISIFIIDLLIEYIRRVQRDSAGFGFRSLSLILMILAALSTAGEELGELARMFSGGVLAEFGQIPSISTIDALMLCFFILFFTGGRKRIGRVFTAAMITCLYLLFHCNGSPFYGAKEGLYLHIIMILLSIIFVIYDSKNESGQKIISPDLKLLGKKVAVFLLLIAVCCAPGFVLSDIQGNFLIDGTLTAVTSFGAGQACLTVANSMFVDTGQVPSSAFYGQILPVTNALPGPLLVKILSSVGYYLGNVNYGFAAGLAMSLAGFGIAIGSTCIICVLVQALYQCFSELKVFYLLKIWILPVICGLLIKVILSMIDELLGIAAADGMSLMWAILFSVGLFVLLRLMGHRWGINDVFVIIAAGAASVITLNLI